MAKLDLYVTSGRCAPCFYLRNLIKEHDIPVNIIEDGEHPLVYDVPTLIMNNASVIKGVTTIQSFLETNVIPKKVGEI